MTKQEAIEILDWIPTKGDEVDAMEMAIEALRNDIVRCKDCKFYVPEDDGRCDVIEQFDLPEMFYCGNGVRGEAG